MKKWNRDEIVLFIQGKVYSVIKSHLLRHQHLSIKFFF